MRFLFASAPLVGHLDWGGFLATASELVDRGHEVHWASGEAIQSMLTANRVTGHVMAETGWRWPLPPPLTPEDVGSPQEFARLRMVRSLDQWFDLELVRTATEELIRIGRDVQPDLLVSEMFVAASGLTAEVLDVPFAVAGWPAIHSVLPEHAQFVADLAQERLQALTGYFQIQGTNWSPEGAPALVSPHLHLTYWSPRWFSGLPLLPQNRLVGGIAPPAQPWKTPWLSQLPMDQPWVFITLGTAFTDDPAFFVAAAHAAVQVGCLPILAVGNDVNSAWSQSLRARLPKPSVVVGRVNFAEVLPYAAAAIHHGGAGTTHALVTHAVPQIVVPHAADQARQAEGVARSGVGYRIAPKDVTVPVLIQALRNALPGDSTIRTNARLLQEEFASLGGVPAAAHLLEALASGLMPTNSSEN
ncbi:MAG: hypothetical protein KF753_21255 [Caldilineaceae bacterium]|nr:hypothetical protein [Caldilineaceae bacterium]